VRDARGRWHDVPFDPNALVVNTGLALQRVSDDALPATHHRVLLCREERVSIPFFLEPAYDFPVSGESLGLSARSCRSPAPTYEHFLRDSLSKFVEYDRDPR
jgi:isopenicillin N synthase-like dioxygenase